ncbi:hypothetical protein VKT23_008198 [Stygiomarasmius scandens]|uniref:F-box domain-containing protein n=1 Tax=Marasmiellus scandens TaxID=2682957 RepID=A0ABR1JKT4_9AGAR
MHDSHSLKRVQGTRDLKNTEVPVYVRSMTEPASEGPVGSLSRRASMTSSSECDFVSVPIPVQDNSPINSLPSELLILIFEQGAHAGTSTHLRYPLKPLYPPTNPSFIQTVTQICHRWRDLALHTSTLWTSPVVTRSSSDVSNLPSIAYWTKPLTSLDTSLRLSRDLPLDITVNTAHMSPRTIIITQLGPHARRWRSLNILIPGLQSLSPLLHSLSEIDTQMPLLESFSITCTKATGIENFTRLREFFPPFFAKCPNLRSITLSRVPMLPISFFPQLPRSEDDLSPVSTPTSSTTSIPSPSPSSLSFSSLDSAVNSLNPNLTTLTLQFPLMPSFPELRRLLCYLPHLENLALHLDLSALGTVVPDTSYPSVPHTANSDTSKPRPLPCPRLKSLDLRFFYHPLAPPSPTSPHRSHNSRTSNGSQSPGHLHHHPHHHPHPPHPISNNIVTPNLHHTATAPTAGGAQTQVHVQPHHLPGRQIPDTRNYFANFYSTPQHSINPIPLLNHLSHPILFPVLGPRLETLVLRDLNTTDWCRFLLWFGRASSGYRDRECQNQVHTHMHMVGPVDGLKKLKLVGIKELIHVDEDEVGRAFPYLEELELDGVWSGAWARVLRESCPSSSSVSFLETTAATTTTKKQSKSRASSIRRQLWPHLRTLSVSNDPAMKPEVLLDAVRARNEAGVPLEKVSLGRGEVERFRKGKEGWGSGSRSPSAGGNEDKEEEEDLVDRLRAAGVKVEVLV